MTLPNGIDWYRLYPLQYERLRDSLSGCRCCLQKVAMVILSMMFRAGTQHTLQERWPGTVRTGPGAGHLAACEWCDVGVEPRRTGTKGLTRETWKSGWMWYRVAGRLSGWGSCWSCKVHVLLLASRARELGAALWNADSPTCLDIQNFTNILIKVFDWEAAHEMLQIHQRRSKCSLIFQVRPV